MTAAHAEIARQCRCACSQPGWPTRPTLLATSCQGAKQFGDPARRQRRRQHHGSSAWAAQAHRRLDAEMRLDRQRQQRKRRIGHAQAARPIVQLSLCVPMLHCKSSQRLTAIAPLRFALVPQHSSLYSPSHISILKPEVRSPQIGTQGGWAGRSRCTTQCDARFLRQMLAIFLTMGFT